MHRCASSGTYSNNDVNRENLSAVHSSMNNIFSLLVILFSTFDWDARYKVEKKRQLIKYMKKKCFFYHLSVLI